MAEDKHTPTLDDLPRARVVVVGDVIRDIWITGMVDRISPEAPVPVFLETSRTEQPGGAGNVAANLTALGITGYQNVLLTRGDNWKQPTKHRFIVNGQQIFRHDEEDVTPITSLAEDDLWAAVTRFSPGCLILSDYGKGTLTDALCKRLIGYAATLKIPVVVDPKGDDWSKYAGATVITPNDAESRACKGDWPKTTILVTRGAKGMQLWPVGASMIDIPATAKEVFDVTGAGDTVVAVLGACLAVGFDMETAARIANAAAGVVVGKRGTATCSLDELKDAYRENTVEAAVTAAERYLAAPSAIYASGPGKDIPVNVEAIGGPLRLIAGAEQDYWIGKVRRIIAEKPKTRDVAHWEKGWQENLDLYVKTGSFDALRPKYIREREPVRWQGQFWMPDDPDYEWHWYEGFFEQIARKWLTVADVIHEFGSGSGHNLAHLRKIFPGKFISGLDWSPSAVTIARKVAHNGSHFDFINPDWGFNLENSVVLTVGAMEQTGRLWRPMLNYLLKRKPKRVVHIEPILDWYDADNPVDQTAIEAHRARGFWEGYRDALLVLWAEGKIEVLHQERTGFGSLLIEGYSQLIWRPL